MKTMTVSMICAGLMTMGTAAIAAEPMQQDVYATLAMSHEDGENEAMGQDQMGGGEMSGDEMGQDAMEKDAMEKDEMEKDEMGHGSMDQDGMDKDGEMDDEMGGGMGE